MIYKTGMEMHRTPSWGETQRRHISELAQRLDDISNERGDFLHGISQREIRAREGEARHIRVELRRAQRALLRSYGTAP